MSGPIFELLLVVLVCFLLAARPAAAQTENGNSTQAISVPCRAPELGPSRTPVPEFVRQLIPSMKDSPNNATLTCYPYFSSAPPSKVVPPPAPRISLPSIAMLYVIVVTAILAFIIWHFGRAEYDDRRNPLYDPPPESGPGAASVHNAVVEQAGAGPSRGGNLEVVVRGDGPSSEAVCEIVEVRDAW